MIRIRRPSFSRLFRDSYVYAYGLAITLAKKSYFYLSKLEIYPKPSESKKQGVRQLTIWTFRVFALLILPYTLLRNLLRRRNISRLKLGSDFDSYRICYNPREQIYLFFGPIDWSFRYQRPQSLASELANIGSTSIYVNPTVFKSVHNIEYRLEIKTNVFILSIGTNEIGKDLYLGVDPLSDTLAYPLARAIEHFVATRFGLSSVLIVQQPGWWPLIKYLQGNKLVFDCMDLHSGFREIGQNVIENETNLIESADRIVVSSHYLFESLPTTQQHKAAIIRNGVDLNRFPFRQNRNEHITGKKTVGYYGAIAEWFDAELIAFLAESNPDVNFELIGSVTSTHVRKALSGARNVIFIGEVPIEELSERTNHWNVGIIPFLLSDLIRATNPVKMYEYAHLGLPIVATEIPEVVLASADCDGIYVGKDREEFDLLLKSSLLVSQDVGLVLNAWAIENSWKHRAADFKLWIEKEPRISLVILMWNHGAMTLRCLKSVLQRSDYNNLEVIIVDNGSDLCETHIIENYVDNLESKRVLLVRNKENYGFAGGNNVGIKLATGEFIVVLNNDTEVSPGWIWRSLKHFYRNPKLGLLGPSTDNCGNEARITIRGKKEDWFSEVVPRFNFRNPKIFPNKTLAFFCTFIKRDVLSSVGLISEEYGKGYFEDDDYCRRTEKFGFEIAIARDVFVHHEMSASFDVLNSDIKEGLFRENLQKYELKWGNWRPHTYSMDEDQ